MPALSTVLWFLGALFVLTVLGLTFRYIPNDRVGIVEKRWSRRARSRAASSRSTARPASSRRCCAAAGTA